MSEKRYALQIIAEYRDQGEAYAYGLTGSKPTTGGELTVAYNGLQKERVVVLEQVLRQMLNVMFDLGFDEEFGEGTQEEKVRRAIAKMASAAQIKPWTEEDAPGR